MIRTFNTPQGLIIRELTPDEMQKMAGIDAEVRAELLKGDLAKAGNVQAQLDAIKKYLGV